MLLTFAQLPQFVARWHELRLTHDDLRELEANILENPEAGPWLRGPADYERLGLRHHRDMLAGMEQCESATPIFASARSST
jgi:hypothetical protein